MDDLLALFRVRFLSVPGPFEQYDVTVEVAALDDEDAEDMGYRKLQRDFPERTRRFWRVESVTEVTESNGGDVPR